MKKPIETERVLILRDKISRNPIHLKIRDGVVVGAMGSDPSRYVGLSEDQARMVASSARSVKLTPVLRDRTKGKHEQE